MSGAKIMNIQNISIRTKLGRILRRGFQYPYTIAHENYVAQGTAAMSYDFGAIERALAEKTR